MNIVTRPNNFESENEKDVKLVRKAALARQILKMGGKDVRIVDIKVDNTDKDHKRSIFAFENSPRFQEVFTKVLEDNERSRSGFSDRMQREIDSRVKEEVEKAIKRLHEEKE